MSKMSMQSEVSASIDQVWEVIGKFSALPEWHPAVKTNQENTNAQERSLTLADGGTCVERLEKHPDGSRSYSYSFASGSLPVLNYRAHITVHEMADKGTTLVTWEGGCEPQGEQEGEAMAFFRNTYETGLSNLRRLFSVD